MKNQKTNIQMDEVIDEATKKRGRPPKQANLAEMSLAPKSSDKAEEKDGWVKISDLENSAIVKELIRQELQKEAHRKPDEKIAIGKWKEQTYLKDEAFIAKLIKWGVKIKEGACLLDNHAHLSRERIWELVRKEYIKHKLAPNRH